MSKKTLIAVGASIVAVALVVWGIFAICFNHPPKNESQLKVFIFDHGKPAKAGKVWAWTDNPIVSGSPTRVDSLLRCPADATGIFAFLSTRGKEKDVTNGWQAFSDSAFFGDTTNALEVNLQLSGLYLGSPGSQYIKKLGGDYSLGVACTTNQGNNILSVGYVFISVNAGTGDWQIVSQ